MRDKISEILDLIRIKKFKAAQIKCDDLNKYFDKNVEFLHIYGFVFFNLNSIYIYSNNSIKICQRLMVNRSLLIYSFIHSLRTSAYINHRQ